MIVLASFMAWGRPVPAEVRPLPTPSLSPTKMPAVNERSEHILPDLPPVAIEKAPPLVERSVTATPTPEPTLMPHPAPPIVHEQLPTPFPEVTVIPIRPRGPIECPPPLLNGPADKNTDELICLHTSSF